jgi:hypothetical protein
MKPIIGLLGLASFLLLSAIVGQRKELAALRNQAAAAVDTTSPASASVSSPGNEAETDQASPELIRLRGQVTGLTRQRAELLRARDENSRLKAQLERHFKNVSER